MNINASIIDQRVTGIVEDHPGWLPEGSDINKESAAFVLLCISTCLEMPLGDNVRVILCNNGAQWTEQTGNWIDEAQKDYGDKVNFVHFNHDSIVNILQKSKKVDTTLITMPFKNRTTKCRSSLAIKHAKRFRKPCIRTV